MFFKRNKKKVGSYARFERPEFKRKLQLARGFRRSARPYDDSRTSKFRLRLKHVPWTWVLPLVVALCFGLYIVFIPNFLFLRAVTVRGVSDEGAKKIQQEVMDYARQNRVQLVPESNILFLQTENLKAFLLAADQQIAEVGSIKKKYPHTLVLDIASRQQAYQLESGGGVFVVSNDGVVLGPKDPSTPSVGTLRLVASGLREARVGQRIFSSQLLGVLQVLTEELPRSLELSVSSIELAPVVAKTVSASDGTTSDVTEFDLPTREIIVYTAKGITGNLGGFKIWFSVNDNIRDALARLRLLLAAQPSARLQKLAYVDMRLDKRSYLCLKDAPCATDAVAPASFPAAPPPLNK